jgi:hypothetical protein
MAAESLYRDANSLLYADNKPSDEAIDRVISNINSEYVCVIMRSVAFTHRSPTLSVSTNGANSLESVQTTIRETSHISMRRTAFSTRR